MGILQRIDASLTRWAADRQPGRSYDPWGTGGYFTTPNGQAWPLGLNTTIPNSKTEEIDGSFESLVDYAYKSNGVVFACMLARMLLFSEARFQWRRMSNGRPGDLFGTTALDILEKPEPGKTTGDLLARAIQDVDLGGNFFAARRAGPTIKRMRPDWVSIILGSHRAPEVYSGDIDAEVVGYAYHPGGRYSGRTPEILLPEEVGHFAPIPDPTASYRGMPWLIPVIREIMGDTAANTHKIKFFENAATPNMVVSLGEGIKTQAQFDQWVDTFDKSHKGYLNAYKTLYVTAGTTATPVGADFQQLEFKATQGAGETRIAAAAGVPPIIVGLSEGLAAATYSNYGQARRRFADGTIRPLWRNFAGSMETIVPPPPGASLWYDDRDISFLREDMQDAANIEFVKAQTIRQLVDGGFDPASCIEAVSAQDLRRLQHTGMLSVQLNSPTAEVRPPLIDQVKAGLLTENEARAELGRPPIEYGDELSPDSNAVLIEQVKAGLRTENEARAVLGLPPLDYSEDLTPDENAVLIDQVKAGLLTHDEARALLKRGPLVWAEGPTPDEVASVLEQYKAGVLTHDEVRELLNRAPIDWHDTGLAPEEVASIIDQVKAGLLTENEARALMERPPVEYGDELSPDEVASLLEQVKAGVLSHDEARALMKRPPMQWSDEPTTDEMLDLVKAGVLTENEARAKLRMPPLAYTDGPSPDDINSLVSQVKEGLMTIEEARASLGRPPVQWPEDLSEKVNQAAILIRAGFDPADVLAKLGLPAIHHIGLPPVTVQTEAEAQGVAPVPVQAVGGSPA